MNKSCFSLLLLMFSSLVNVAQDQKFHFGLKVTPTVAWFKSESKGIKYDDAKLGFSYGIIGEYNFADNYSIASGVQITYRGGGLLEPKIVDTLKDVHSKWNLQYVELPITIKMKTKEFSDFRFFGQFGFVPGVNVRAKAEVNDAEIIDAKNNIKSVNLSMLIAIGTEYTISGSTTLLGAIEFNNGFLDVMKKGDAVKTDYKVLSNYIGLTVGIMF